jgi:bifunctional DNA-binding transcriptional regulator/antitoxin component of YhaV-PrlF toxin-antitoxin module
MTEARYPEVMASKTAAVTKQSVGRVGQRRQVVIPQEIFDRLQMQAGDVVAFSQQGNAVVIKPRRVVDTEDTLTPEEVKIVRRGEAQLRRGQSNPWRDVKVALAR